MSDKVNYSISFFMSDGSHIHANTCYWSLPVTLT